MYKLFFDTFTILKSESVRAVVFDAMQVVRKHICLHIVIFLETVTSLKNSFF